MAKKKKPAKKQASKAKGQTPKASPAKAKAPPAKATASPAQATAPTAQPMASTAKRTEAKLGNEAKLRPEPAAKPAPAASPAPKAPGGDATSAKARSPAAAPSVAASHGGGAGTQKHSSPNQKSGRPSGGKSADKASGAKQPAEAGAGSEPISEAALPLQTFAVEMQRMAKQSIEQTTEVLERLRDAKSVEEVVSLQTTFMQQSFRRYTEFAGRISQLMTSSHASLFQQGQAAMRSFRSIASGM